MSDLPATTTDTPTGSAAPPAARVRARRTPLGCLGLLLRRSVQLAVLLVLFTLVVLVAWLQSNDFRIRATRFTESLIEGQLGEEVTLSDLDVRFWPPGIEAVGFHVFSAGNEDETILAAERIRIPVVLRDGGVKVGQLFVQRPTLHLHLDEEGKLVEFRNLVRPPPDQRKPLTELPWGSLRIVDGEIRLDHAHGHVLLEGIDLSPTAGPVSDLTARLEVRYDGLTESTALRVEDIVLGPEEIVVPDLLLDLKSIDLHASARIPLVGAIAADATARVDLEEINPLLKAPRAAHGTVDLDLRVEGTQADPVLYVNLAGQGLGADMPGVFTPLLTYDFGEVTASAVIQRSGADIEQLVLDWADGRIVAWGHVTPDKRFVGGHVTMQDARLEPLLQAFDAAPTPWIDFRMDAEIACEGTLDPLRLEGTFDFGVSELRVGDRPISRQDVEIMLHIPHGNARGTIVLEKDHVFLAAPTVRGPRSRGSMEIDIGFGPRGPLDLQFDLSDADLSDFGPLANTRLTGTGRVTGSIAGPFNKLQFQGQGDLRGFSVLGIEYADHIVATLRSPDMKSIWIEDAQALLGSSRYHGYYGISFRPPVSMNTEIVIDAGRVEDLVHMFVELDGLKGDLAGDLWLRGPIFDLDGVGNITLANAELYGEKFPTGEGHGYLDEGLFTLDDLRVRRDEGRAGITLRGSVDRAWKLDMELRGDGLRLETLDRLAPSELPLSGDLSFSARITNTMFDPSPDGRIRITNVRYAGAAAEDSFITLDTVDGVGHYRADLLGGHSIVEGTLGLWGEQPYQFTADLRELPAHLFYPTAADGTPITAAVSGRVDASGDFGEVWSPVALRAEIRDTLVRYASHELRNVTPWTYEQEGDRFELTSFGLAGGRTAFQLSASGGDRLVLDGSGRLDLDLLRAMVPGLEKATGTADVELSARGTRPNVEAVVGVKIDAELLRHSSAPLTFEDTVATLEIREHVIDLFGVSGGIGGGTFTGKGSIEARDWTPVRYDLEMSVDDAQVQWVETLPPAIGDGTFRFDGPVGALLLSGEVEVSDMTFSDRIDWEDWVVQYRDWMLVDAASSFDEEPLFSLDIPIRADRTIHLRNNVAEGTASADLRIIGDTVRPGLIGAVTIEEGALAYLQDREFRVDRGNLLFNDPWTWDPELDISLLTEIDSREQQYRVDYGVVGPFSDWHSVSRSDPPLPQADVNALLWFGMTTDDLEAMGELSSAVVQSMADLMLTDFFVSGQAGDLGGELPVHINLATGVNVRGEYSPDPRLLVEKRLYDYGGIDLKWELNLVQPDDNYVALSKRLGEGVWSLSGWYATLQRDRVLPIGGAYGVDVLARWEME